MNNNDVRNAIALEAELRIGKTRYELGYKCEETCAEGVTDVLNTMSDKADGFSKIGSTSCNTMYANMSQSPYWYEPSDYMKRGDIIFFDWDRIVEEKPLDHVGIVVDIDGDTLTYANINGSNHNKWTLQTMNKDNLNIAYWLRYINPTPQTEPTATPDITQHTEDIYNVIEKLQALRDDITAKIDMYIRSLKNVK